MDIQYLWVRGNFRDKLKWIVLLFFPALKCNCKLKFKFESTHFNLALGHFCINFEFTIYVIQKKKINKNLRIRPANHKATGSTLAWNSGREVSGISLSKQECILVGDPRGQTLQPPSWVWAWKSPLPAPKPPPWVWSWRPPPVDRMTDTCKNITFANFVCRR